VLTQVLGIVYRTISGHILKKARLTPQEDNVLAPFASRAPPLL
jgi:hypothetical protein